MIKNVKSLLLIAILPVLLIFLIWTPFLLRMPKFWNIPLPTQGFATIVSNYDGPLYIAVAKTFYDKELLKANYQFPLTTEYYTAHFPLFPTLIKLGSAFTSSTYSMMLVTIASGVLASFFFFKLAKLYLDEKNAVLLTLIFSFFPARWLIVKSVGSADPLFVASIIASVYYFKEKKFWLAGLWGALAQLTKSPAILLFASYFVYWIWQDVKNYKKYIPLLLIPLSLLGLFAFYYLRTGDFFAYFNSGDNIHLFFPPFQIFNYSASWVGTFWLEEIIFIYFIGAVGVAKLLLNKDYELGIFSAIFFLSLIFVSHRDLMRYALPLMPFLFIAFSKTLLKKEFKLAFFVILIPVYLFSLTFISQNVMPISNWTPFL